MKITWSLPVFSQDLESGRGDLVRARGLIEALRAEGHEVRVVEAWTRPGRRVDETLYREVARRLLPSGARLALRDAAWWWRSRSHGRRVAEAAARQGARILVETQVHGTVSGSLAAGRAGLPLVLDDVSPLGEVEQLGAGLPGLARWTFERQRAQAALLVAPTVAIAHLVAEGPSTPPVAVVPNGVDLEAHERASRVAGRRVLGLREEVLLGFAGSFQPWHDVPLLVRAFAALETRRPTRLLLVGDGPGRERALSEARARGVDGLVLAPGRVAPGRIPELLAACDVGVLPGTNAYGQPMKLLEYAAAGLPSVAPDLPRVREVVRDGVSGVLFVPGDGGSLRRALDELIDAPDRRLQVGGRARSQVAAAATWACQARRLARLLHHATAQGRADVPSDHLC